MRVLMVGPDRSVHGGISGVVNNYYDAGLDKKIDLCYIGTMVEGSKIRKMIQAVIAYFRFLWKVPRYEIVHVNMASDTSYMRKSFFIRTAKVFHKKIVIHQHGGDFEGFYNRQLGDKGRKKVKKILSMGDAFLVLAPPFKDFFGRIIDKNKITVLPDAIQVPLPIAKEYGQHRLLFLGRICKAKGIEELLESMPVLKEKFPDVKLYIGGIFEEQELQKKVEELSGLVEWIGWVTGEEKEKYLRKCDVFVLPSYFEGQSVSILEAMSHSCTVVASRIGGIPQMIEDGETGILVEPKNAESLRQGLEKALADSTLCERLGKTARKKVAEEFSIEKNMEQLLGIYEAVWR
ncbi:MAG: glycosyltransferase family 4 protein [Lachnospiraceae bacterium]|nr:glycosyltransferase family 4 protein [Lachnospiraceae bacterium]